MAGQQFVVHLEWRRLSCAVPCDANGAVVQVHREKAPGSPCDTDSFCPWGAQRCTQSRGDVAQQMVVMALKVLVGLCVLEGSFAELPVCCVRSGNPSGAVLDCGCGANRPGQRGSGTAPSLLVRTQPLLQGLQWGLAQVTFLERTESLEITRSLW